MASTTAPPEPQVSQTTTSLAPKPDPASAPSTSAPSLPADRTTWTEAHYTAALTHLTSLQDRIDALRDAIPSLIRPIAAFQPSRQSQPATVGSPLAPRIPHDEDGHGAIVSGASPVGKKRDYSGVEKRGAQGLTAAERRARKEKAFGMLKGAAGEGSRGIRELRGLWEEEGTKEVLRAGRERGGEVGAQKGR
ncbi:hypothetical protein B9Z65_4844 [Elsinoe australis]|uniref:Uncharacterized protein n=1 Tax=Elsinoe australis TaxID=40998 RepID=A0A2P8A672_9PEZI|nr:hypothetical protein B9Z65_4844 [Elsinoe australis]